MNHGGMFVAATRPVSVIFPARPRRLSPEDGLRTESSPETAGKTAGKVPVKVPVKIHGAFRPLAVLSERDAPDPGLPADSAAGPEFFDIRPHR
jgi:hypothetical protein